MASRRRSVARRARASATNREARARALYRGYRVKVKLDDPRLNPPPDQPVPGRLGRSRADSRWFNPILADPDRPEAPVHPDNTRRIAHGSEAGYFVAGCGCFPCTAAGTAANERQVEKRLAVKLAAHRELAASVLRDRIGDVGEGLLASGAHEVVAIHRVHQRHTPVLDYHPPALAAALRAWAAEHDLHPAGNWVDAVSAALLDALDAPSRKAAAADEQAAGTSAAVPSPGVPEVAR